MKATSAIMILALLVGCERAPIRGVIVKKNYRPSWMQIVDGGNGVIIPIEHPEQWDVVVQNDGTDGEQGRFLVVVSREYWDASRVGGVWERGDTVRQSGGAK